jgi:tetratricopeptide (TPR) repeat protein
VTWQQTFDTPLTDLFQVQSEIAVRVARGLDLLLGAKEQEQLEERPTRSIEAYDAFLKGEEARKQAGAAVGRRLAISNYEQAVALDSGFALAWARMAQTYAGMYFSSPTPEFASGARLAAERAATIAPGSPVSHLAMGAYYTNVLNDQARGQKEYVEGLRLAPNDVDLLVANAVSERALGRWEATIEPLRRALSLDPRSSNAYGSLAMSYLWLRRYPEAVTAVDQAIALAPGNATYLGTKVMIYLAQGDLPGALAVVKSAPREIAPTTLAAYFAVTWDLFWILDEEQQRITLRLTPAFFDDDPSGRALAFAGIHHLRGASALARAYGDTAHQALARQLRDIPDDNYLLALDGVAQAFAGRKSEAIRSGERAMELLPLTADGLSAPYNLHLLIRTYLLVGEKEKALDAIRQLLAVPYFLSPGWLKVDPAFTPLRGDPRFEELTRLN